MGGRNRALAIALAPSLGGAIVGCIAFALHFGEKQMLAIRHIPWDMIANYECFLIGWNLSLFVLWIGPAVAAVLLLIQPRLRDYGNKASSNTTPPGIEAPFWVIAAIGTTLILGLAPQLFFFGSGSHRICYEISFHPDGWIMLGLVMTATSPAATMAALTGAYVLWRRDYAKRRRNPVPIGEAEATPVATDRKASGPGAVMRPCGIVAILIGVALVGYGIWQVREGGGANAGYGIGFIAVGCLLLTGSLRAARFAAWCAAAWLVAGVGAVLIAPMRTPWPLLVAEWHLYPWAVIINVTMSFAQVVLAVWFYQSLRAKPIMEARRALYRSVAPPWTGFAAGVVFVVIAAAFLHYMQSSLYGRAAKSAAAAEHGNNYSYHVTNLVYADGTIFAEMIGYNDAEIMTFEVKVPR